MINKRVSFSGSRPMTVGGLLEEMEYWANKLKSMEHNDDYYDSVEIANYYSAVAAFQRFQATGELPQ